MTAIGRRHFITGPALLRAAIRRPTALWIMTDEHRLDLLGSYESKWAYSPNPDRLAESGVRFESAYTPSPVCVPARCSLLTGNSGSTIGVLHNQVRLSPETEFLTWSFEQAGYMTASFGKKHYVFPGVRQSLQTERGSAPDGVVVDAEAYGTGYDPAKCGAVQYPDSPTRYIRHRWILAGKFPSPISESAEDKNVNLALRWLEQRDGDRPFLLRLSLNAPHTPVVAPERFLRLIDSKRIELPVASNAEIAHATAGIACPAVEARAIAGIRPFATPVFSELEFGYQKYRDSDRQVMIREGRFKMSMFISGEPDGELHDLERKPLEWENHPARAGIAARLKSTIVEWDRSRGLAGAAS